jgi:hypothetical protein
MKIKTQSFVHPISLWDESDRNLVFYLAHMEYGKWWKMWWKMTKKIADFQFLGFLLYKKHDLSTKKIRLSRSVAAVVGRNLSRRYRSSLES